MEALELQNLRELLQYVPKFVGKVFAIEFRWASLSDSLRSELMLDLAMLQNIGVKLILILEKENVADFLNRAIDVELRLENDLQFSSAEVKGVLDRGQFVMVAAGQDFLAPAVSQQLAELKVNKVIVLLNDQRLAELNSGESFSEKEWSAGRYKNWSFHVEVSNLLEGGVNRVHILDSQLPSAILSEIFSNEGSGLMIYRDSYRLIRKVKSEDIPDLLTMIGRSVRTSLLVPREYEDVERLLDDYCVYQIDENVVGCVALHCGGGESGEIACLYVKHGHQGRGYGEDLVRYAEVEARRLGLKKVFALTNNASKFFGERLSYRKCSTDEIPEQRAQALKDSGRDSLVFMKSFS